MQALHHTGLRKGAAACRGRVVQVAGTGPPQAWPGQCLVKGVLTHTAWREAWTSLGWAGHLALGRQGKTWTVTEQRFEYFRISVT